MAAVICVSVALMVALVFRADREPGGSRPGSGRQRNAHPNSGPARRRRSER
jgi:hypothetical protein